MRYTIKGLKIWDNLLNRWVINGSHPNKEKLKEMCSLLNKDFYKKNK